MAKKRMFHVDIVENDVFLDMPLTSQSLYFHLGMNADDDGFVSPKRIMRMIGAGQDDLQVLIAKRYILMFPSGVVVVKHWHKNNTIQNDRYSETTFKNEKNMLTRNEWGQYTEKAEITTKVLASEKSETNRKENVSILDTQIRLDKTSIDKTSNNHSAPAEAGSKDKKLKKIPTEELTEMMEKWEEIVGMNVDNQANRKACAALIREIGKEKVLQLIKGSALALDDKYAPRISDFVSLKRKKNDLIVWGRKNNNNANVEVIS